MLARRALRISPCVDHRYRLLSCTAAGNTTTLELPTRRVPDVPSTLGSTPTAFLEYLRSPTAEPLIFRAPLPGSRSLADRLLRTLREAGGDRLVEVEVGKGSILIK